MARNIRQATIDGVSVAYELRGTGQALLFLHGLACGRRMWAAQLRRFSSQYRCLALDFPGHGASDALKRGAIYSEAGFVRAALAVLDHAGIERAVVVGHSLGGGIAVELAIAHPARVSALLVADAGSGSDDAAAYRIRALQMAELLREHGVRRYAGAMLSGPLMAPYACQSARARRHMQLLLLQHPAHGIEATIRDINAIRPPMHERPLARISCPTLVVCGALDTGCLGPARHAARVIPAARYAQLPGVGHMAPLESPPLFNSLLNSLLTALRSR